MKKILTILVVLMTSLLIITGCSSSKSENLSLRPEEVLQKIYAGISSDELPMLANITLDKENASYYLGTDKVDFKEAIASEPMMGSMAYSVVAIKLKDGVDVAAAKKLIKENVNPAKWICVDAEIVTVDNVGDTILLVMMDELNEDLAKKIQSNFKNLK